MQDLLEVHVGTFTPARWDERERAQAGWDRERRDARPRIAAEDIAWTDLGLEPRWVGDDTSNVVAAIEASNAQGGDEWRRFQAGAAVRSELALYVSTAAPNADEPRSVLFSGSGKIDFPYVGVAFYIGYEAIPLAREPELADRLNATDKDLALRIRNERPTEREWLAFKPGVYGFEGGHPFEQRRPQGPFFGTWTPLLVTPDGRTVAGVWSDDGNLPSPVRHYVLPDMPSYQPILQWLGERAVPDLVPTAAARIRRNVDLQPELQTDHERDLTDELGALTAQYEGARADLESRLAQARAEASPVRHAMLFGTGSALEAAVAQVLADAGLDVELLDEKLGGTVSGDLLVEHAGHRILVEVKSSGGPPSERLTEAVRRHLQTWPQLRPSHPLTGAVLIVNHQYKQQPADRSVTVYQRREFVDSLEYPVVSTLELFDAWRHRDWAAIREAVGVVSTATARTIAAGSPAGEDGKRSWWERRRKNR